MFYIGVMVTKLAKTIPKITNGSAVQLSFFKSLR